MVKVKVTAEVVLSDWDDLEEDDRLDLESNIEDALVSPDLELAIAEGVALFIGYSDSDVEVVLY